MREILFRGKRVDNGEWVTGTPFIEANCCKMITAVALHPDFVDEGNVYFSEGFPVRQETVGQYIGAADKNGCKIFEGDVVLYSGEINLVEWDDFEASFFLSNEDDERCYFDAVDNDSMFIIGNIYDNPELLENNTGKENSI